MGKLEAYGLDRICDEILEGESLTAIAAKAGVRVSGLVQWLAADPDRSARARECRAESAKLWDEKAVAVIEAAADPFELAKAKELSHHFRWKASKIAPKEYGDKIQAEHSGSVGLTLEIGTDPEG